MIKALINLYFQAKNTIFNIYFEVDKKSLYLFLVVIFLVYLPTFLYPYLLTDETWLVAIPSTHIGLGDGFGRYLFAFLSWGFNEIFQKIGFYTIYLIRGFAVFWLALTGYLFMRWFEFWGYEKKISFLLSICIITLPAYQIVVADGAPLAFAIFIATLATYYFFVFENRSIWERSFLSSTMLLISLTTYQQQVLVALALLSVPLITRNDWRTHRSFMGYGTLVTLVTIGYFAIWKFILYPRAFPGRIDDRYGPDAITIPGIDRFYDFIFNRLLQISNFWNVQQPVFNWLVCIVLTLILIRLLVAPRKMLLFKVLMITCLVIGSDFFRFVTGAYHSYVTAPALSFVLFYVAFSGADLLMRKKILIFTTMLTAYGCYMAFTTVKNEIAIPNWHHIEQIRGAVLTNPDKSNFHIDFSYKNDSVSIQEFQWRNGGVYLFHAATAVFEDLAIKGAISKEQLLRLKQGLSLGGTNSEGLPNWMQRELKRDSVTVILEKP